MPHTSPCPLHTTASPTDVSVSVHGLQQVYHSGERHPQQSLIFHFLVYFSCFQLINEETQRSSVTCYFARYSSQIPCFQAQSFLKYTVCYTISLLLILCLEQSTHTHTHKLLKKKKGAIISTHNTVKAEKDKKWKSSFCHHSLHRERWDIIKIFFQNSH